MLDRGRTLGVMPRSIQHSTTETDETLANTENDAHQEFVVVDSGAGRDVVEGAR